MAVLHVVTEPGALALSDVGAIFRCQVLDTSEADGDMVTVAGTQVELTNQHLAYNEDGVVQLTIELDLNADEIVLTPGRDYTVAVHVDHSGDQRYASGDSITTQSYPLPPALFSTTGTEQIEVIIVALTRI